jgi:hypothetical protein
MAGIDNTTLFSAGDKITPSQAADIVRMQVGVDSISRINHTGNPEGVVSANPGSLSHDPSSGDIYYKQTGSGNTGWITLNSGLQRFRGPEVNLLNTGVTTLFTPVFDIVVVFITSVATNLTGLSSGAIANFGFTAPDYTEITNGFQLFPQTQNFSYGAVLGATFGETGVCPGGTPVKIKAG